MLDRATLDLIEAARTTTASPAVARRLIGMIDLTSLEATDTRETIDALCAAAVTPHGPVAAVCVLPHLVGHAHALLVDTAVKVATVVDFPGGKGTPEDVLREAELALRDGAEEIDIVFPYRRFLSDSPPPASENIRAVREAGGYEIRVKVILETGAYPSQELLAQAAQIAIQSGADFLKTSTGKHETGATLEAAAILLSEISASGLPIGFKASGGIREVQSATAYLTLAESMMGDGWATPAKFRIGASGLLPKLLQLI